MKIGTNLQDVVHAVLTSDYAAKAPIDIVREQWSGSDVAVAFQTGDGSPRRGFLSLSRDRDGAWEPSGGWSSGRAEAAPDEVFVTCGGWGGSGSRKPAVFGGWVADVSAVSARLIDPMTGHVLTAPVMNEVVIFMAESALPLRYAQVELLDANQSVLRAAPAQRRLRRTTDHRKEGMTVPKETTAAKTEASRSPSS